MIEKDCEPTCNYCDKPGNFYGLESEEGSPVKYDDVEYLCDEHLRMKNEGVAR